MSSLWKREAIYALNWAGFEFLTLKLAGGIGASGFLPDLIVAIGKGGIIPAVRLCHLLGVDDLAVILIKRNTQTGYFAERQPPAVMSKNFPDGHFKSTLVVDDIAGTGATLEYACQLLPATATGVKTAALIRNSFGRSRLDFWGIEVDDWVSFPWECQVDAATDVRIVELVVDQ